MIKKTIILFSYFIFIVYSLEILTTVFLIKENTTIVTSDKRKKIAKNFGVSIDDRLYNEVFNSLKKSNQLKHEFRINMSSVDAYKNIIPKLKYIPLKGPINSNSLGRYSNENGNYKIYNNDKYGFRNENKIYLKKLSISIIGDSFAEGVSLEQSENVSSILINKHNLNTANFGIAGTSLISYYAVFKEYVKKLKPENVILFYYEGNDFLGLNAEKNSFISKYLDKDYIQNLVENSEEVKNSLKILDTYTQNEFDKNLNKTKQNKKKFFLNKEKIIDFLEIQNLRKILKIDLSVADFSSETDLFKEIVKQINEQTLEWGGKLMIVYVPSWGRYNNNYKFEGNNTKQIFELKNTIFNYLEENSISYIDLDSEFLKSNNPSKYYNFEFFGHFNSEGYMLVSDLIKNNLN